jgi:S-(hydroxymethyl)glutathione dehydrogenase/alcohol dehydrogenase
MGAALAGASQIVAIDRVVGKLEAARSIGATDAILAQDDSAATAMALRDLTDGGPDYVFEAIGRPSTVDLAMAALPVGGTAVLVGMTPLGDRGSFEVYPFVDGGKRIIGSNYGSAEPTIDFPRYATWSIEGRLPISALVERRIGLDEVEDAFEAMRNGRFIRQLIDFD